GMPGEIFQETEFRGGGGDEIATDGERHGTVVDDNVAGGDDGRRQGTLEAAEHSLDAGDELARAERLGDVIVRTEIEAGDFIGFRSFRGEEDDRRHGNIAVVADLAADVETVVSGNHDVEKEKRRWSFFGLGNYAVPGEERSNGKARAFQVIAHQPSNIGIIFDDKNRLFHEVIVAK